MSEVDERRVEMLREEYERQMGRLEDMQRRMKEVSATALSRRRELSVTVDSQGVITELKFLTDAYRKLARNELSELVTRTIADAREKALDQVAEIVGPSLPPGLNPKDVLSGEVGAADLRPDTSRMPDVLTEPRKRRF